MGKTKSCPECVEEIWFMKGSWIVVVACLIGIGCDQPPPLRKQAEAGGTGEVIARPPLQDEKTTVEQVLQVEGDGVSLTLGFEGPTATGERPAGNGNYGGVPKGWQSRLRFTVKNVGSEPIRIANGKNAQGYMVSPFGLELTVSDPAGRTWAANPGAGGPALPVGQEHLSTLAPGEELTRSVPLGRRLPSTEPFAQLWSVPGRYLVRARWVGRDVERAGSLRPMQAGAAPSPEPPVWLGKTGWVQLEFELP